MIAGRESPELIDVDSLEQHLADDLAGLPEVPKEPQQRNIQQKITRSASWKNAQKHSNRRGSSLFDTDEMALAVEMHSLELDQRNGAGDSRAAASSSKDGEGSGAATLHYSLSRQGVDPRLGMVWLAGVLYLVLLLLPVPDADAPWRPTLTWLCFLCMLSGTVAYCNEHSVSEKVCLLKGSVLAYQLGILFAINCIATLAVRADPAQAVNTAGSAMCTFTGSISVLVVDVCDASQIECSVSLATLIIGVAVAIFGNLFLWNDAVLYEGHATESGQVIGGWTRNEVRRR